MEQHSGSNDQFFFDDFSQVELEISTSNTESNQSTLSPHSQDNFSDSNSLPHPGYFDFDFDLPNEPSGNISLDDCLIDIGLSNLDDETCADSFIADLLDDTIVDQSNQSVLNFGIEPYNNGITDIVDLNSNKFYQLSENKTANQKEVIYNDDILIEMDDDDDDDYEFETNSTLEYSYSPENDSVHFGVNSRKNSLVSRPARKTRNKCRSLPYTVHDLQQCQSLNNEDIVEGKPGECIHLSNEEIEFFKQEGLPVPTHLPLTKEELRTLKTIRRKIRNKISAKNSRAKKQVYVYGLEKRVAVCNEENIHLKKKVKVLENDNKSLLSQVRHLRDLLSQYAPQQKLGDSSKPSLCLCMITFLMLFMPYLAPGMMPGPAQEGSSSLSVAPPSPASRRLLQERDLSMELGDPYDITVRPSPAWKYPPQSPVVSALNNNNKDHKSIINTSHALDIPSNGRAIPARIDGESLYSYQQLQDESHSSSQQSDTESYKITNASTINLNTKEFQDRSLSY